MKATKFNVLMRVLILVSATCLLSMQPDCSTYSPVKSICMVQP